MRWGSELLPASKLHLQQLLCINALASSAAAMFHATRSTTGPGLSNMQFLRISTGLTQGVSCST